MQNGTSMDQKDIDEVWRREWQRERGGSIMKQFSRLFTEGYRVYAKYLPDEPFSLLEIGAGSGRYGIAIARDNPAAHVTISDPLQESTELISDAVKELGLKNVSVRIEDSLKLSFGDRMFDIVFADVVVQHIIDTDTAMKVMIRVLKPGGTLMLSTVNTHNPFHFIYKKILALRSREYEYGYERTYTPRELTRFFEKHGLTEVRVDGFFMAYGMYRWGYTYSIFKLFGRMLNRCITHIDRATGRHLSRKYGFIVVCVGIKK